MYNQDEEQVAFLMGEKSGALTQGGDFCSVRTNRAVFGSSREVLPQWACVMNLWS